MLNTRNKEHNESKEKRTLYSGICILIIAGIFTFALNTNFINTASAAQTDAQAGNTVIISKPDLALNQDAADAHKSRMRNMTNETAQRKAAAQRLKQALTATGGAVQQQLLIGNTPHYFGPSPNYATSPLPNTGVANVTISDPTGTGASAVAIVDPTGAITGITLMSGGTGYTAPTVTITGSGTGAMATATASGSVTGFTVTKGGSGYTSPTVNISDPKGAGASATVTVTGSVSGITVTNGGNNYTFAGVNIMGDGTGAAADATISGSVTGITVTKGGSGYTSPTVTISDLTGTGAFATATIAGSVAGITVNNAGTGYTFANVNITGDGTGAAANATVSGYVTNITVTNRGSGYTSPTVTINDPTGTGATATANLTSSVARITVTTGGTNYTFVNVGITGDGTGAVARATINGSISGISVVREGSGYTFANVDIIGDGTGATANATVSGGVVTGITVTNGGSNYTFANIAITGDGTGAIGKALVSGSVSGIMITNPGTGYTFANVVIAGDGTGAAATANITRSIASITVTNGGSNYTAPTVNISDPTGTGAAATANMTGAVTGITVTNAGSNYTFASVNITGDGTGATANARVSGPIASITVTGGGSNYTAPTVAISDPTGTGAAATANMTGAITGITVTNGGTNYTFASVNITGDGTGATANARVSGSIASITVTGGGSNYTAPTVTISDPTGTGATATAAITGSVTSIKLTNGGSGYLTGGIRKFVDSLPGLTSAGANNLGQYLPIAVPDTTTYPGSDYYEIALVEYSEKMHSDLNPTKLRGYVQENGGDPTPHYLGPVIIAQKDRPVRVKFTNRLPTGAGGDLFIPVDPTVMGAGDGPKQIGTDANGKPIYEQYTENRATLHLHGGRTPWISDGTPHQWITPAGEATSYPQGVSVRNVPDMPDPGPGAMTFFYTNNQSARFMFYHDHSYGITRLNVYAGEAAGYLIQDPVEQGLVSSGIIPADQIPLVIEDKSFVPDNTTPITNMWGTFPSQLAFQDPTWDTAKWGGPGNLYYPHVYLPLENPGDPGGINAFGRWPYAPWFWPPGKVTFGPVPNPYYDPANPNNPMEPYWYPGLPNPSYVGEAFMDTPVVNGAAYPNITVEPKAYRFRILNAANDRFWNLQLYQASPIIGSISVINGGSGYTSVPAVSITGGGGTGATATASIDATVGSPTFGQVTGITLDTVGSGYTTAPTVSITGGGGTGAAAAATIYAAPTEVGMVPAVLTSGFPAKWPTDGRPGGVPNPATAGPSFIQIGTESGFLPKPVVLANQPVDWNRDMGTFDFGNVNTFQLLLGPAERADVIVDFSAYAGKTLILYNDAPAPNPANDPRLNYYTGDADQTDTGGAPTTLPGYGPNTRTIMQIKVNGSAPAAPFNMAALDTAFTSTPTTQGAFVASQDTIIVPQAEYDSAYNASFPPDPFVRIHDTNITFTPIGSTTPVTFPLEPKAMQDEMGEAYDTEYGRLGSMMGLEMAFSAIPRPPQAFVLYPYASPPVELIKPSIRGTQIGTLGDGTQIWSITHNGVDAHPIHWHGFDVQLINRVAWDNNIRKPGLNELGWKETVVVNPLQNTIIALRPLKLDIPFDLPNSIRLLDPTKPPGAALSGPPLGFQDPKGNPVTVLNHPVNFGWEYVWHCHILAHEESDLMHGAAFAVPPVAPVNLAAAIPAGNPKVRLTWTDNSLSETGFIVQRALNGTGNWVPIAAVKSASGPTSGTTVIYDDKTIAKKTTYNYRVLAANVVGDTVTAGFPTLSVYSEPSNTVTVTTK